MRPRTDVACTHAAVVGMKLSVFASFKCLQILLEKNAYHIAFRAVKF